MEFFDQPQGAAIFKHAVLKQYVPVWASKLGSRSDGMVAFLDGFAGAGSYLDGTPGSPLLALQAADALAKIRDLRCYFVEENAANHQRLVDAVAATPAASRAAVYRGDIEEHIDSILAASGSRPLFAFLDPFGLGIPFDVLVGKLLAHSATRGGRRAGPPTEVLVNFTHAGLYRNAGKLDIKSTNSTQLAAAATVVNLTNRTLGGSWWQDRWHAQGPVLARVGAIREEYVQRVLDAAGAGWECFTVPVADSWNGQPIYELLLFTQHVQGRWFFNEAVSHAHQTFEQHFATPESLMQSLWEPAAEWTHQIAFNLRQLLSRGKPVPLAAHTAEVYGSTLGYARGIHVRPAVKRLYLEGVTSTEGKGALELMTVAPIRRAHAITA